MLKKAYTNHKYLFYSLPSSAVIDEKRDTSNHGEYLCTIWRPSMTTVIPSGVVPIPFAMWWLFHTIQVFSNNDYSLCLIYHQHTVIHRTGVFPRYFRFPFMAQVDLQLGDLWTHPDYRSRGLATIAIKRVINEFASTGRRFWYVTDEDNSASIHVIEKAGFIRSGEGTRTKRLGVSLLGSYVLNEARLNENDQKNS
ncbi:MAG TPA: GNAT family N-acetyltransferase [Deltaproteobacteria bacterium]|nr:GNAT family N-acetyltransferase [Deltaproteobacteria bacterium]